MMTRYAKIDRSCFMFYLYYFLFFGLGFCFCLFPFSRLLCVCVSVSFVIWSRRMSMLILSHFLTRPEHMWIFNWRVNFLSSIENEIEWVRSFHTYLAWIKCSSNVHTAGIHSMIDVGWHTWIAYTKRTETTSFRGKYRLLKKNKLLCGWLNSILFRLCHFTPHFGCCVWSDRSSLSSARRILCGDGVFVCGLCACSVYCLFLTMFRLFFSPVVWAEGEFTQCFNASIRKSFLSAVCCWSTEWWNLAEMLLRLVNCFQNCWIGANMSNIFFLLPISVAYVTQYLMTELTIFSDRRVLGEPILQICDENLICFLSFFLSLLLLLNIAMESRQNKKNRIV